VAIPARIRQRLGWRARQGGPSGGHHLVRASEAISFADILRSIDGPPALAPCASLSAIRQCSGRKSLETCTIRPVLLAVRDASTLLLEGMPLARLVS
jgi:DNA-binding IscR family transcriptional regulator